MTKITRLPNGITCVCDSRPGTGTVSMAIGFAQGRIHDAKDQMGMSVLMQEMLWAGTDEWDYSEIIGTLESWGCQFDGHVGRDNTAITLNALTRYAPDAFRVISHMIREPRFDTEDLEEVKAEMMEDATIKVKDPAATAYNEYIKAAFIQPGVTTPSDDEINARAATYTVDQVRARHDAMLSRPDKMVVSFSGDITPAKAQRLVQSCFGDLKTADTPEVQETPDGLLPFIGGDTRQDNKGKQLFLTFGFPAPHANDPARFSFFMLESLFSGGMAAPLSLEIREKRGLVYTIDAAMTPVGNNFAFTVQTSTSPKKAKDVITCTIDLLGDVVRNGFSQDAMNAARSRMVRSVQASTESAASACAQNLYMMMDMGRILTPEELDIKLAAVTQDDVRAAAAALLRDGKYALAAVGPHSAIPSPDDIRAVMAKQLQGVDIPVQNIHPEHNLVTAFAAAQKRRATVATDAQMTILPNGLKVVTATRSGTLCVSGWVGVGSDNETADINGITHMIEHMMFRGTPTYGPGIIDQIVEDKMCGSSNAMTGTDSTNYDFSDLLPEHLDQTVDICGEMIFKASLDDRAFNGGIVVDETGHKIRVAGERDVVLEEIGEYAEDAGSILRDLTMTQLYQNQCYGRPVAGTVDSVSALTTAQLVAYRDQYYVPNNVAFVAAGPVKHADFVALIDRKFGSMPAAPVPALPTPVAHSGIDCVSIDGLDRSHFQLAFNAAAYNHPDELAYQALSVLLAGGPNARVNVALDKHTDIDPGSVLCHFDSLKNLGVLGIGGMGKAEDISTIVKIAYKELHGLSKRVTALELDSVKAMMEMATLSQLSTSLDTCGIYGEQALHLGEILNVDTLAGRIQGLTSADIRRVAKNLLDAAPSVVIMVPPETEPAILPSYDDILAFRDQASVKPEKKGKNAGPAAPAPAP
ncbi:M16 family metallopeptidase [Micavibrio aeruginosavorus]|uniref:Peptidase, M16 family n=1 Tax=Micavibrio aeruginosavorus EPB TaxID=349215 RepID=M4VV59_9BACT|nr:pitrilysin family protein [Micavibrio aeruginosavorus]AGH97079.1 peptidase, M16 family [Micavibrio aeruginosavorus EPB]